MAITCSYVFACFVPSLKTKTNYCTSKRPGAFACHKQTLWGRARSDVWNRKAKRARHINDALADELSDDGGCGGTNTWKTMSSWSEAQTHEEGREKAACEREVKLEREDKPHERIKER